MSIPFRTLISTGETDQCSISIYTFSKLTACNTCAWRLWQPRGQGKLFESGVAIESALQATKQGKEKNNAATTSLSKAGSQDSSWMLAGSVD